MKAIEEHKCTLCDHPAAEEIPVSGCTSFRFCENCRLLSRPPESFPGWNEERLRYLTHTNHIADKKYQDFLRQLGDPVLKITPKGSIGLDYGCGQNTVLCNILEENGMKMQPYDPVFFPRKLTRTYDFIVSTETFEHFFKPGAEITKLLKLLKPGGYLGIMTQFWENKDQVYHWRYARDYTHVCLYHRKTFDFIARQWSLDMKYSDENACVIFQKN